jgi:hypothetical protein
MNLRGQYDQAVEVAKALRHEIADLQAKLEACEKENVKMLNALIIAKRYLRSLDAYHLAIIPPGLKLNQEDFRKAFLKGKFMGLGQVIEAALPPNAPDDPNLVYYGSPPDWVAIGPKRTS